MDKEQNQEVRSVVLEVLAARYPVVLTVKAILRRVGESVDYEVTAADVERALTFQKEQGHAEYLVHPDGAEKFWRATSRGCLEMERREV